MATTPVQDLPSLGNIADSDKLVGEKTSGTTGLINISGILYDADFSATQGLMTTTSAGTYANRTITGVANRTTVTNGAGTSGDPIVDISAAYVGQSTITTLGTVTTGTWSADNIPLNKGGTNAALTADNGAIFYSTGSAGALLASTATASKMLLSGASAAPTWSTSTIPSSAGATPNKYLKSDGTNWVTSTTTLPDTGTSGKLLRGNGSSAYAETTATFADTYAASTLLYSNGADTVTGLATANNGILVTSGAGVPSISTDIPTAVTVGGSYNYRAGGTDVTVSDGGTGLSSTTAYAVLCGGTTSTAALQSIAALGSAGARLTSGGAGALPTMKGGLTAFAASRNSAQTLAASTITKIQFSTEIFDTGSFYDNATNYRFQPTVAGKYLISMQVSFANVFTVNTLASSYIYKNGASYAQTFAYSSVANQYVGLSLAVVLDLNGSSDYVEGYAVQYDSVSRDLYAPSGVNNFISGVLVEAT